MSNWSHVAAIIRIYDFGFGEKPDFDKLIGKEWMYESPDEMEREEFMPSGSEGSLHKIICVDPNISAYTVSIFGDLRNHDDGNEIVVWFKNKCEEISENYGVRNAVITITNEWNGTVSYTYER